MLKKSGGHLALSIGVLLSLAVQRANAETAHEPAASGSADAMSGFVLSPAEKAKAGNTDLAGRQEIKMRGFELSSSDLNAPAKKTALPAPSKGTGDMRGFALSPAAAAAQESPRAQNLPPVQDQMQGFALSPAASAKPSASAQLAKAEVAGRHEITMRGFELSSSDLNASAETPAMPATRKTADMQGFVLSPARATAPAVTVAQDSARRQSVPRVQEKRPKVTPAVPAPTAQRTVAAQRWLNPSQARTSFANGSSMLADGALKLLDEVAHSLLAPEHQHHAFSVEGHANAVGPAALNQTLSTQRAAAVVRYLTEVKGVPAERLVFSIGKGTSSPVDPDPVSATNRCAVITIKKQPT